jgi:beta-glucanase (GH16 family)
MTKHIKISLSILFLLTVVVSCKQSDPIQREYSLVWSDEFNGTELDLTKWEVQTGDGSDYGLWRWGNNEDQYYRKENISVDGGSLKIKSIKQSFAGYDYTSARIRSLNKGDFKYGKIEASIRMDKTVGLWHAFWMLPSNPKRGWPFSGEIDIMEYVGKTPDRILNYIHFADVSDNHQFMGAETIIAEDNNFHKYSVEWNENEIVWYRDSVETYKVLRTNERITNTWPFDAEFHLLLNTAIGGNLGGPTVDANALQLPKYMVVDYVRVYQAK